MKIRNHSQKTAADVRRLSNQLKALKMFTWSILNGPRIVTDEELEKLRNESEALILQEPVPQALKELTS